MKHRILTILLLVTAAIPAGAAEERKLPLESFIDLASQRNTTFEEILGRELTLQYREIIDLPADDLMLSVKTRYILNLDGNDGSPEYQVSLDRLFPATATRISGSWNSDFSFSDSSSESSFSLTIVQPIAENAFGRSWRLKKKRSGIESDIARYQIIEAYEDYLASLIGLYYDWYAAAENLATARMALRETEKQLDNILERAENHIALPIDINKIRVQAVSRKENLLDLENRYQSFTNLVREAIRDDRNDPLPVPVRPAIPTIPDNRRGDGQPVLNDSGRTALMLDLLEEKAGIEVAEKTETLLPSISLTAGIDINGNDLTMPDPDTGLSAGIHLELPLPGKQEKALQEISRINRMQVTLRTANARISLETALRNLCRSMLNQQQLIVLASEKIALSRSVVRDEQRNYSLGKTSLSDLIDEINRLEQHRVNLITREIELQKLLLEWKRLNDTLVRDKEIRTTH